MRAPIIKDNKGQSLIETAFLLAVFIIAILFTLRMALKFILLLSVDDFLESYLLCNAYRPAAFCRSDLNQKMRRAHIQVDSVRLVEYPDKLVAHLQISNGLFETVRRSREYNKK